MSAYAFTPEIYAARRWLSTPDPWINHTTARKVRHHGTENGNSLIDKCSTIVEDVAQTV